MRYLPLLLILFCVGTACKSHTDSAGRINLIEKNPIAQRDSKTQGYYDSRYYMPNVVRMEPGNKNAYIFVDSPNQQTAGLIDKGNREEHYKKAVAMMDKNDLKVHHAIWALPEVQRLQLADGGYNTIVTYITSRPGATDHYTVELRRNNIEEMTPEKNVAAFTVKLHPLEIQVADESGYYVSLKAWRSGHR